MISNAIAMKKTILAKNAALAAIPPNPKIAATTATIKNTNDRRNIIFCFKVHLSKFKYLSKRFK